jgi:glycosyltransferase involved in cell wall biosynthesis
LIEPRLRILGVADAGASHTRKWANYFAGRGHEVHLVSYAPARPVAGHLDPNVTLEDWILPPFHIKRFGTTLHALFRLRRIVRERRPHLVQVHFLGHGAWYAALAGGPPLALWVMGGDIVGTRFAPTNRRERILTPFALRRASLVTAWSRNLLRIVEPMVRPAVPRAVVVGGVDTSLFRPLEDRTLARSRLGLQAEDFVILSCRLLWPRQHILTVVQSLPFVLHDHPRARLVIVKYRSDPAYLERVEAEIDRLSLRPHVRLLPEIPNEEMASYLSLADCVVSIPESDGTPMTVMEAAACGAACVIRDLPDYDPEVFVHEQSILRVPLRDPSDLGSALARLAADPSLRKRLRAGGHDMVETHASYAREMGRLEDLYRGLGPFS